LSTRFAPRSTIYTFSLLGLVACHWLASAAAPVDVSQLPQSAQVQIDFARDIKPILTNSCYKCHSGEKPKSHFLLTSRESALKGGSQGVDIIPGQSAKSPLIHYVARLVEDMAMPPEGKGTPLTTAQVSLLRAWIDQGVLWEKTEPEKKTEVTASVNIGGIFVNGDQQKFRELNWLREGLNGGLNDFELKERLGPDAKFTASGHFLKDDYKLTLEAEKNDLGFARFGWSQYRKYYDDKGGYYPQFPEPILSLNQDLHKDIGRAWAEVGLTLPNWPRMVLGYEYQYRDGSESTLHWGPVVNNGVEVNIFPGFRDVSERVHILKFDADYDLAGIYIADNFRAEWYHLDTRQWDENYSEFGTAGMVSTITSEQQSHFQGANTIHLEKQITDWLFASGGYLYSKFDGDASVNVNTLNFLSLPPFPGYPPSLPEWQTLGVQLEREAHVFSVSCLLGSWEGLTLSLGTQNEWSRQSGLGSASNLVATSSGLFGLALPESYGSDYDNSIFGQSASLRFTKIPFTTLYAEARLSEMSIGHTDVENGGLTPFLLRTDETTDRKEFRVGFNTSPWRRVSLSASFRRYDDETDYNFCTKTFDGYPGFIRWRDLLSNEVESRLSLQLASWIKTSFSYRWLANDYRTRTDSAPDEAGAPIGGSPGGSLLAGQYRVQGTSVNATLTPWRRLFFSTTFSYENAETTTFANGDLSVAPYKGATYAVIASVTYILNDRTDLSANYSFSRANFTQDNLAYGLPLGIDYTMNNFSISLSRKFTPHLTGRLQYLFYQYNEPSSGGATDYTAHGIFATLTMKWP
jgi:hypothetical protein